MEGRAATLRSRLSALGDASAIGSARAAAARVPLALWVVLGIALVTRIVLVLSYRPAILAFSDSAPYLGMAGEWGLFTDPARPIGYPLFLRAAHAISADVDFTIALQHLLGIATGLILYAAVRRLRAPVWVAVIAAAAVLLPLDPVSLEHTLASEPLFTFVFVCFLYAAIRGLDEHRPFAGPLGTDHAWIAVAGGLLGLSAWVRGVAMPLIPFFAIWALLAVPGGWRARIGRAVAAGVPAVAVVLAYFAWNESQTGTFGLHQTSGWGIYSRVAQFADCSQFTPPEGTEQLCETTPTDRRPGPDFYSWIDGSPARALFGPPPAGNDQLGEFGWAVVKSQPLEYAATVGGDFLRFLFPAINDFRPYAVADYEVLDIQRRDPPIEEDIRTNHLNPYYDFEAPVEVGGAAKALADLQEVVRLHPLLLFEALLLALFGVWRARGPLRWGIVLLAGAAVLVLAVSAASNYNARYAIPVGGPLLAAGALGLWVAIERFRSRVAPSAPETERPRR
jgi:hypothetical protein